MFSYLFSVHCGHLVILDPSHQLTVISPPSTVVLFQYEWVRPIKCVYPSRLDYVLGCMSTELLLQPANLC